MERVRKIQKIKTIDTSQFFLACFLIFLSLVMNGCARTYPGVKPDKVTVSLASADRRFSEEELLDVHINVFDPGKLPSSEDAARGLSDKIRTAEAHYIPVHLKTTIQQTGAWGSVRVGPEISSGDEVIITGTILNSNGEELELEIEVFDSTCRRWFIKKYKGAVEEKRYDKTEANREEPFQNLYNKIANDLLEYRKTMTPDQAVNIRRVAEMRFAEEVAPDAFAGYVKDDKKTGLLIIDRLPSEDDEMLARIRRLRERDYMLTDTLDAHYENLNHDMYEVYRNWRKTRLTEMNLIRELDRDKIKSRLKGAGMILGGIAAAILIDKHTNSGTGAAVAAGVGAAAGISALSRASEISKESEINKAALEELGVSFEAEVDPFIVELEGERIELTGSASEIIEKWRKILKRLYQLETGGIE